MRGNRQTTNDTARLRLLAGPGLSGGQQKGPLLDAHLVAAMIGGVSAAWVRRNVPGKLDLGHSTKRWWRADVLAWIQSRREDRGES